jgi:hypothetical protein
MAVTVVVVVEEVPSEVKRWLRQRPTEWYQEANIGSRISVP